VLYWLMKWVFIGPLLKTLWPTKVVGAENIPETGGAILAGNHLAVADSFFMPLRVKRKVTFPAKSEYFTEPGFKGLLKKWFFTGVGQFPIDRSGGNAAQAALDTATRLVRDGHLLGIYPEGTRSPDGRLYKGKTGVARIALDSGGVVVPVAMIGTDKVNPIGSKMWWPRRLEVRFRQAPRLFAVRGPRGRPLHRAVDHRRDHVRPDGAFRPGVRRHLRGEGEGTARRGGRRHQAEGAVPAHRT